MVDQAETERISREFMTLRQGLFAYINASIGDYQDSEDIFQEVWLSVLRAANRGEKIQNLRAWCLKVARNQVMRHRREKVPSKRAQAMEADILETFEEAFLRNQHDEASWARRISFLRTCMEILPARSRKIVSMRYFDGLTIEQMTRDLDKPAQNIYLLLSRVRRRLRACVDRALEEQESPA